MVLKNALRVDDLSSAEYLKQQEYAITPEQIKQGASLIKPSGNFRYHSGYWEANPYTGFAVVSMVNNHASTSFLNFQLLEIQDELKACLGDAAYMLPAESFHQTVANLLSNQPFTKNIVDPGIEPAFPAMVAKVLNDISKEASPRPVKMKMLGVSIFGTAIGMLGVFDSEDEYHRIKTFRRQLYSNLHLNALGIHMTRPFIGHITLAYVERDLAVYERTRLATAVNTINRTLRSDPLYFYMTNAELRRYHTLAEFKKEAHYPVYHF